MPVMHSMMKRRARWKDQARKRLAELAWRPIKCPFGTAIFVIGLSGVSGDVVAWQRVIDQVTRDQRVLELAEQAAAFGSQTWVRAALVAAGVLLILWRLPWFWRLRHKLIFNWRRLLDEEVWIDSEAALDVLRNSTWAEIKKPVVSVLDNFVGGMSNGLGPGQKLQRKFRLYLEFALETFSECNSHAVRTAESGEREYEEGALRRYAREAMREEVIKDFGENCESVPRTKLTAAQRFRRH